MAFLGPFFAPAGTAVAAALGYGAVTQTDPLKDLYEAVVPEWVRDLLREMGATTWGKTMLIAVSSAVTGPLQATFGAQLGSIGFALPGVFEGKGTLAAWTEGFVYRVTQTAQILGGWAVKDYGKLLDDLETSGNDKLAELIKPLVEKAASVVGEDAEQLSQDLQAKTSELIRDQTKKAEEWLVERYGLNTNSDKVIALDPAALADAAGVRGDAAEAALALWQGREPDYSTFDEVTGEDREAARRRRIRQAIYVPVQTSVASSDAVHQGVAQAAIDARSQRIHDAVYGTFSKDRGVLGGVVQGAISAAQIDAVAASSPSTSEHALSWTGALGWVGVAVVIVVGGITLRRKA